VKSLQKQQNSTTTTYYYDPQSAGINLQSPQSDSTPWTLTLHEGVKTEVCHICGSSFFDKVGLSIHMNGVHVEG
jgi:hypothetical protein